MNSGLATSFVDRVSRTVGIAVFPILKIMILV